MVMSQDDIKLSRMENTSCLLHQYLKTFKTKVETNLPEKDGNVYY